MGDTVTDDRKNYLRNIARHGDPLAEIDRMIVSPRSDRWMQLRWRLPDQISARAIAAIFRDMANRIEVASEPKRYSERDALGLVRAAREQAQARLDTISKPHKNKRL